MKIELYFKRHRLGTLQFENGQYTYNSNLEGERGAKEFASYILLYGLENSNNLTSDKLWKVFADMLSNIKLRKDILNQIGATDTDTDFEILYKYAGIPQIDFGFHIIRRVNND